ncbi:MAG: thioredoxin family protein [Clostridiaceae bacterium]|nr:thioredoxin family protein [Clostridiaceae bacterium]
MHEAYPVDTAAFRALLENARPVLACFVADWSPPCREMSPMLDLLADGFYGTLEVVRVDPDQEPLLAAELRIASLPTLLLFIGGTERERMVGLRGYADVEKKILKHLGS